MMLLMRLTSEHIIEVIETLQKQTKSFSVDEIATHAGCSRATVFNHLKYLKNAGKIEITTGNGHAVTNEYRIIHE